MIASSDLSAVSSSAAMRALPLLLGLRIGDRLPASGVELELLPEELLFRYSTSEGEEANGGFEEAWLLVLSLPEMLNCPHTMCDIGERVD